MIVSNPIPWSGEGRTPGREAPARGKATVYPERRRRRRRRAGALPRQRESGFTLVELMVVIVILGLLATIVAINVLPALGKGNTAKAKTDIATIEQALEMYRLDNLTYPSSTEGLQALVAPPPGAAQPQRYRQGGYIKRLPSDPWGHPYRYVYPGQHGAFDVFSYGADDKEGGEGENADIGNWQ